jgi:predicted DNA binding CopG/RHH family protein
MKKTQNNSVSFFLPVNLLKEAERFARNRGETFDEFFSYLLRKDQKVQEKEKKKYTARIRVRITPSLARRVAKAAVTHGLTEAALISQALVEFYQKYPTYAAVHEATKAA